MIIQYEIDELIINKMYDFMSNSQNEIILKVNCSETKRKFKHSCSKETKVKELLDYFSNLTNVKYEYLVDEEGFEISNLKSLNNQDSVYLK
jgi:hypothetical protein